MALQADALCRKPVARDVLIPVNFELSDNIANVHWEFAPDLQTMEKATAAEEADYLARRADLTKASRGSSEFIPMTQT